MRAGATPGYLPLTHVKKSQMIRQDATDTRGTTKGKQMAKARKSVKTEREREAESGLTSLQIRLPTDVHEKLKDAAKQSQLSLNQLMTGICQFAADNIRPGRPEYIDGGETIVEHRALQCVWFGHPTRCENDDDHQCKQAYFFLLDYSGRNAVSTKKPVRLDDEGNPY